MKKWRSGFVYAGYAAYYLAAYGIGLIARRLPYYRRLWLIAERKTDARDNGLHFFRYLTAEHPEINAAFLITRQSPDYHRAAALGKVIEPGTFRHMLAFACAKVRISTHYMGCAPDAYRFRRLDRFRLVRGKNALIRHGITANDLPELHYPGAHPDLLVCSAIPEYQNMLDTYGHPNGVVQLLGLCRYDRLLQAAAPKRQILIMPTWRYFLRDLSQEAFRSSTYYQTFMALLTDPALQNKLEAHDYRVVFYLHYELQPYSGLFTVDNPRIEVRCLDNADVQDLLMESAMLITDYSSVFFDFAYMQKPLAYLQFDEQRFYETQYRRGYFRCSTDGFGPVFQTVGDTADYICRLLDGGMETEPQYKRRAEAFFGKREANHCEKTFQAILRILS